MSRARSGVLRPKLIALSVAACFALAQQETRANPTGPSVASGSASFATAGSMLTVTNSANAIIQWQGFSIGINEITRFLQPSAASAVLNRVVGAGGAIPQSVIDGVLSSNGHVYLLNPSGVVIGATARIDVAGLVASSLNLSNEDFLNGRLRFAEVPGAGGVANHGVIETPAGGRVFLVAPDVQNSGIIRSPQGEIVLAAGKSAELVSEGSPYVVVTVNAGDAQALNIGSLIADSGRIGMYGALVRHSGVAEASGAAVGEGGQIRFVAAKDLTLEAGSRVAANGQSGGSVLLQAQDGTNFVAGTVEATGSAGKGGTVQALGVRVGVIGQGVIDASGETGGGTVLVGGDYRGGNPEVQNAERTYIGPNGVIRADARTTGDGGRVIVWADEDTRFFGTITARGGSQAGNGGFVETSGKQLLQAFGKVDVGAPKGKGGTWLLDPLNVTIDDADGDDASLLDDGVLAFDELAGNNAVISPTAIQTAMFNNAAVTIEANGSVTFNTNVDTASLGYGGSFTVLAASDIDLKNKTISIKGEVRLEADYFSPDGVGSILSTMPAGSTQISTGGWGPATLRGASVTVGGINTRDVSGLGYYIKIQATSASGFVKTGDLATGTGPVEIRTIEGNITTGMIDTSAPSDSGYSGGTVFVETANGVISTGDINTSGADGPEGGGSGGWVALMRTSSSPHPSGVAVTTGSITTKGGNALDSFYYGAWGGFGGDVIITSYTFDPSYQDPSSLTYPNPVAGSVTTGAINTSGGDGNPGMNASGFYASDGGRGGDAGSVRIAATSLSVTSIVANGGNGGAGGNADLSYGGATGGLGGSSGAIYLEDPGPSTPPISSIGGKGGPGGDGSSSMAGGTGGAGGSAGDGGEGVDFSPNIYLRGFASLAALTVKGGDGGSAGADNGAGGGIAGYGGPAATVYVQNVPGALAINGPVTVLGGMDGDGASVACCGQLNIDVDAGVTQSAPIQVNYLTLNFSGSSGDVTLTNAANIVEFVSTSGEPAPGKLSIVTSNTPEAFADVRAYGDVFLKNSTPDGIFYLGEGQAVSIDGSVTVVADNIAIGYAQANTYFAWSPTTNNQSINVDQSFFNNIDAPKVILGSGTMTGNIELLDSIDLTTLPYGPIGTLSLVSNGAIFQTSEGGSTLIVNSLNVDGGTVSFTDANQVNNLQGRAKTGDFFFDNTGNTGTTAITTVPVSAGSPDAGSPAGLSASGTISLLAGGAVTQSAAISASGFNVQADSVTLLGANSVGNLQGSASSGNFSFNNSGALNVAGLSASGTVALTAGGAITQSAGISGAALDADGTSVTLLGTNSVGSVQGSASGGNFLFSNAGALDVGNLSASADVSLLAGGAVTQSGGISAIGLNVDATSVSLGGTNSVTNLQGRATAGDFVFSNAGATNIASVDSGTPAGVSASGAVVLASGGTVTQSAALNVSNLSVTAATGDIVLSNAANRIATLASASAPGNIAVVNGVADTLMNVQSAQSSGGNATFVSDQVIFSGPVSAAGFVEYYTANDRAIGVTPTFFNNVSAPMMKLGNGAMTSDIALLGAIAPSSINALSLITNGTIYQSSASDALAVASLNADGGSVQLIGSNQVQNLQARAKTGLLQFINLGALNLTSVDPGNPVAGVSAAGSVYLQAGGSITSGFGGAYSVQGSSVQLFSTGGSLGTSGAPLEVKASTLEAGADQGIYLNTNQFSPAPVTVNLLENLTSGDIVLNAWGGATTTALVYNPGGDVGIHTFSPLSVLAGIQAGDSIFLSTSGVPSNDMTLDGPFTYGGAFEVTVGEPGVLTFGPGYTGVITLLVGGGTPPPPPPPPPPEEEPSGDDLSDPSLNQTLNSTNNDTNNSTDFTGNTPTGGDEDEDEKKEKQKFASCGK